MELQIETNFFTSNFDANISTEDDLLITFSRSKIKVDYSFELSEEDYFAGVIKHKNVGHISVYRINLDYSPDRLLILADLLSQDLCFACSFFFLEEEKDLSTQYIYYIDEVLIQPEFRGLGFGMQGLAMFLQNFASHETVASHPSPLGDYKEKYTEKHGKFLLKKYWSRVGFEHYSEENNILWTDNWQIPNWLRKKIFSVG